MKESGSKRSWWLTTRRLRAHGLILAICLWGAYVWIFSNAGLMGRNGVLKGADFLHFYTLAKLAQQHRGMDLYNMPAQAVLSQQEVPQSGGLIFVPLYGPQVSLLYRPLAELSYAWALLAWQLFDVVVYGLCCYAIWRVCANLHSDGATVLILALGYPAFFHLLIWGQSSIVPLACFTLAYLELRAGRLFAAGLAVGCLAFKPQLGLAAAVVFLLSGQWKLVSGAVVAAIAQLSAGWLYYGTGVMRNYWYHLVHLRDVVAWLEPRPYQTHSLRSFWGMLIHVPHVAFGLYLVTSLLVLFLVVRSWKSGAPLELKFSMLLFASVLVSPHLTVYDLVILAPAFLLLSDWMLASDTSEKPMIGLLLYLCYWLPLVGPLSRWTHVQLLVLAMVGLVWILERTARSPSAKALTPGTVT